MYNKMNRKLPSLFVFLTLIFGFAISLIDYEKQQKRNKEIEQLAREALVYPTLFEFTFED